MLVKRHKISATTAFDAPLKRMQQVNTVAASATTVF